MVWKKWTELDAHDKLELLRSEMFLTSGVNNMLLFGLLVFISVVAPWTKFTVWIPLMFLILATATAADRWKENKALVDELRGSPLAAAVAEKEKKRLGK